MSNYRLSPSSPAAPRNNSYSAVPISSEYLKSSSSPLGVHATYSNPMLSPRSRLTASHNYSSDYVNGLEVRFNQKQHEREVSSAYERSRLQENLYERNTQSLRSEILSLRHQIDLSNQTHLRETNRIREEYEYKLNSAMREKEESNTIIKKRLNELQSFLEAETNRTSELRQELSNTKLRHSEEVSRLNKKIIEATQELERVKSDLYTTTREEINALQRDKEELEKRHALELELNRDSNSKKIQDLQREIQLQEQKIQALEYEVADLRRELAHRTESAQKDIANLQETLEHTRRYAEVQEQDLERMRQAREAARKENRLLSREMATMEYEFERVKSENQKMSEEIPKLEKIVYGRTLKKNGSPKK